MPSAGELCFTSLERVLIGPSPFSLSSLQYIVECHGITLLPQFLGMYRLNVDGVEIYVIVTRNVFSHRLSVYRKYDLKVRLLLVMFVQGLKLTHPSSPCHS